MPVAKITESRMSATPNGPEVATILVEPNDPVALMVLGHGAGTPIYSPTMAKMSEALADHRIATFRYNYPYSESMITFHPELIDPLDVLLDTTSSAKNAAKDLSHDLPLFLGGRSMSSQVVSLAMTREDWRDVRGIALYVYPTRWRNLLENTVNHLQRVQAPMLFVQGGCDEEFADLKELQSILDEIGSRASLYIVEGADHFYNLPKESGKGQLNTLSEVASVTSEWIQGKLGVSHAPYMTSADSKIVLRRR